MPLAIRPFTSDDYPAVVNIHNVIWPEYAMDVDEYRYEDGHRAVHLRHNRWVAEVDGRIVGWTQHDQIAGRYHPDKYWLEFYVLPDYQRQGIGAALYTTVINAVSVYNPWLVRVALREDMTPCLDFLKRRGFGEDWRSWESRLEIATFDPTRFRHYAERVAAEGIEIRTYREMESDPDRNRKLYTLIEETRPDAPMRDAATAWEFEAWETQILKGPHLDPDGFFIAVRDGNYVGVSSLLNPKPDQDVEVGWTGVRRPARGIGLAQALKLRAAEYAIQRGYTAIRTSNNSLNYPMLAINEKFGFVRLPAWVYYVKYFRDEG